MILYGIGDQAATRVRARPKMRPEALMWTRALACADPLYSRELAATVEYLST